MPVGIITLNVQEKFDWVQEKLPMIPILEKRYFHHLTVAYRPSDDLVQDFAPKLGIEFDLTVIGYYSEHDINGLVISPTELPIQNKHPHITVSCAKGVWPAHSNTVLDSGEFFELRPSAQPTIRTMLCFQYWD